MSIFQLIAFVFAVFMIYVVRVKNRKYKMRALESWGWYVLWIGFVLLTLFPDLLRGIAHTLNFSRTFDLLLVGALMVLTTVLVFAYFKIRELDQKLERYVREEALRGK